MRPPSPIASIAVIGAGIPLWTTAAMLASALQSLDVKINVLETGYDLSHLFATLHPLSKDLHDCLGIRESHMLDRAHGAVCLGAIVEGIGKSNLSDFRGYGLETKGIGGVKIHHFFSGQGSLRQMLETVNPAAQAGRNALFLDPNRERHVAAHSLEFGYVVDPGAYCDLMKRCAIARGAILRDELSDDSDLVVDLRPAATDDDILDWRDLSRLVPHSVVSSSTLPALDHIPTATSEHWSPDNLKITCWNAKGGIDVRLSSSREEGLSLRAGYLRQPWQGNTLKVGPAASFLGALGAQPSLLLIEQLKWLTRLMPVTADCKIEASEFNRLTDILFSRALDFAAILNPKLASDELPETAQRIIEQFTSRGHLTRHEGDPRSAGEWLETLVGRGFMPLAVNPLRSAIRAEDIDVFLDAKRSECAALISNMTPQRGYLDHMIKKNRRKAAMK